MKLFNLHIIGRDKGIARPVFTASPMLGEQSIGLYPGGSATD